MEWIFDIVGLLGAACILVSYGLSQAGRMDVRRWPYPAANALGAALILVSLTVDFNLAATVIEGAWLGISVFGVGRALRSSRRPT